MTPTITLEALRNLGAPILVYVRPVKARDVLDPAAPEALDDMGLSPDQTLYALHRADGERLAVMTDRDAAYAAALANALAPVSVH